MFSDPGFIAAEQIIEIPQLTVSFRNLTQPIPPPPPGVTEVDLEPDPPAFLASADPIESSNEYVGEPQNVETEPDVPTNVHSTEPREGVGDNGEAQPDVPATVPPSEPPPTVPRF